MRRSGSGLFTLAAAGALIASSSTWAAIEVIFSDIAGQPTAAVPNGPGFSGTGEFELFDRPFASPNGQRWVIQAQIAPPVADTEDRIIVVFDGTTASTVVREGLQAPWTLSAETVGFFDVNMGITDDGQFAFSNDTSGPTTSDLYVVKFDGTDYVVVAQEGQPIPDGGGNYAATQDGIHITSAGTVGFYTTASAGGSRCMLGSTAHALVGITVPTNQASGGTETIQTITGAAFFTSADGANSIYRANLNGDTTVDEVVVINNAVVLREGETITGMDTPNGTTFGFVLMMPNGDWLVRGSTTDSEDYVVRNGALVARTGQPIASGDTELFDDATFAACFFWMQGNNKGDYVIGGVTDSADANANAVLVLNGTDVVARENDMVDLNGNGLDDDDAFISVFNNDDGFLTDDLQLYFTADLRNGAGVALGQAFLRIDLNPAACPADTNDSGAVDVDDLIAVILGWGDCKGCPPSTCDSDINDDCATDVDDLIGVILGWGPCP